MRRTAPTLAALVLLALPAACQDKGGPEGAGPTGPAPEGYGGPTDGGAGYGRGSQSAPAPAPAVASVPIDPPPDTPVTTRSLQVDGNAETRKVDDASLFIDGYYSVQIADTGLPRAGSVPSYREVAEGKARTWPEELELEVPSDGRTRLVAWVDIDGSGTLSSGDRCGLSSEPIPHPASGAAPTAEVLPLRIDRIYVSAGATDLRRSWKFEIDGDEQTRTHSEGTLLVLGYLGAEIQTNGFPGREVRPRLDWKQDFPSLAWPVSVQLTLPADDDLWLLPVLDLDGDGRLGPGDRLGRAGPFRAPAEGEPAPRLVIDQALPDRAPSGPRNRGPGAPDAGGGCYGR